MLFVKEEVFTIGYEAKRALSECKKYSSNCSLNSFFISEPTGSVFLKPYYIDQYEVTNSAYQKCVDAKVCEPPQETRSSTITEYYGNPDFDAYPVIYVDWYMAKTYCEAWRGARLPTEAEWEKAARATSGSLFPWGNILEDKRANFCDKQCPFSFANRNWEDGYADTAPVDALPNGISAYGVFNMAGNVWEWTSSLYKPYPYDLSDNREYLQTTGIRVVRGGSWRDDIGGVFSIARNGYEPSKASDFLGFRCAKTR
jgi:formylglycine-generating enzyme required for sulfatase activity